MGIVSALLDEEQDRLGMPAGRETLPMRPDLGHTLGEERSGKRVRPGYSYVGLLRGFAKLRGVIHVVSTMRG